MNCLSLKKYCSLITSFALLATLAQPALADPVDWVNLYIGTGSGPIGYGRTMPFVTPPFGMTNWTAQTRQNHQPGLSYVMERTLKVSSISRHGLDQLRLCSISAV